MLEKPNTGWRHFSETEIGQYELKITQSRHQYILDMYIFARFLYFVTNILSRIVDLYIKQVVLLKLGFGVNFFRNITQDKNNFR